LAQQASITTTTCKPIIWLATAVPHLLMDLLLLLDYVGALPLRGSAAAAAVRLLAEPLTELRHLPLCCSQLPCMTCLQLSQAVLQVTELQQQQQQTSSAGQRLAYE
jgi:hypothetical protein